LLAIRATSGLLLAVLLGPAVGLAQEAERDTVPDAPAIRIGHGDKGFELETGDGRFLLQLQARLQFRISYPFDSDPVSFEAFAGNDDLSLAVRRARLKVGGHAFEPWLKYYFEYELASSALLNFEAKVEKLKALSLHVGQWKVEYNRERMISSGRQQTADRSILTYPFTIDRQQGVSLYGRLQGGGAADFSYWAGVFSGNGRGESGDDEVPMWTGRLQWNVFGRPVPFQGSDLDRSPDPALIIALAGATNRSPYTRFSAAGGGQLPGFDEGVEGQYRMNQAVLETALMWKGISWQQELHWKEIDDRVNGGTTELLGNLVQLGYFFGELWSFVPPPLELAGRYAFYDPDRDVDEDDRHEFTLAANWFFKGHLNKLTAEISYLDYELGAAERDGTRFRLQWDVSF
jgi:phosphate-selective porin OprO/OprP